MGDCCTVADRHTVLSSFMGGDLVLYALMSPSGIWNRGHGRLLGAIHRQACAKGNAIGHANPYIGGAVGEVSNSVGDLLL
jgi:hypothetical protein